jgi:hypothetical protein
MPLHLRVRALCTSDRAASTRPRRSKLNSTPYKIADATHPVSRTKDQSPTREGPVGMLLEIRGWRRYIGRPHVVDAHECVWETR